MTIVVDGFNAPVTGGNFVDLVDRGFYDGMDVQRSDGFVVQTGKPSAKGQDGFIDPVTRKERTRHLERTTTIEQRVEIAQRRVPKDVVGVREDDDVAAARAGFSEPLT